MTDLNYGRTGYCSGCGECCKELVLKIKYRIDGELAKYLKVRGVGIEWGPRYTILRFPDYPCPELQNDNSCALYNKEGMPRICYESPKQKWQLNKNCNFKIELVKK